MGSNIACIACMSMEDKYIPEYMYHILNCMIICFNELNVCILLIVFQWKCVWACKWRFTVAIINYYYIYIYIHAFEHENYSRTNIHTLIVYATIHMLIIIINISCVWSTAVPRAQFAVGWWHPCQRHHHRHYHFCVLLYVCVCVFCQPHTQWHWWFIDNPLDWIESTTTRYEKI